MSPITNQPSSLQFASEAPTRHLELVGVRLAAKEVERFLEI